MSLMGKCWAPCFTLNSGFLNLINASYIISIYTAVIHVILLFYAIYILKGGESNAFYSPLFEFNQSEMNMIAIFLVLYCIAYITLCSLALIHGINTETRFYYLPWLYCTLIEILFMVAFGIFMVYRYYHNEWATFASIIIWSYSGYHFYLYIVVISLYYHIKELQEPTFIILYP